MVHVLQPCGMAHVVMAYTNCIPRPELPVLWPVWASGKDVPTALNVTQKQCCDTADLAKSSVKPY